MANVLYTSCKQRLLAPGTLGVTSADAIDTATDNLSIVLVDGSYTPAVTTDTFYDPTVSPNIVGTPVAITTRTVVNGNFDAPDVTFTSVSGNVIEYVVLYKNTGTTTTSPLMIFWDTMTGLPVTPNGGDITISWDPSGIFRL